MRPTTVFSFLAASMAVLSPVYAAPVPIEVGSAGAKRMCTYTICRTTELPSTGSDNSQPLLTLVNSLIAVLTTFKDGLSDTTTPTNTTSLAASSPIDLASPELGPVTEIDIIEPDASA